MGKLHTHSQTPQTRAKRPAPPPPPQQATTKHKQTDAHKDTANTRQNKNTKDPQKKHRPGTVSIHLTGRLKPVQRRANPTPNSDADQDT